MGTTKSISTQSPGDVQVKKFEPQLYKLQQCGAT